MIAIGGSPVAAGSRKKLHVSDVPGPGGPSSSLAASDIKSRFFDAGPTNLYAILGAIDDRIAGFDMRAAFRLSSQ